MKKNLLFILSFFIITQISFAGTNYHYFKTKIGKHMCVVAGTTKADLCFTYGIIYKGDEVIKGDGPSAYIGMTSPVEITYKDQKFCVELGAEVDAKKCIKEEVIPVKDELVEETTEEIITDVTDKTTIEEKTKNEKTEVTNTDLTDENKTDSTENINTSTGEIINLKNNIEEVDDSTTEPITSSGTTKDEETGSGTESKIIDTSGIAPVNTSKKCNIGPINIDCGILKGDFSSIKNFKEIAGTIGFVFFVIIILSLTKKKKPKKAPIPKKKEIVDPLAESNDFF